MHDTCRGCGAPCAPLCGTCDGSLARALTAEQLRVRVIAPAAALVGPDGVVVPLGERTVLGRDPASCEVALLCASVSARHARIERIDGAWAIVDLGSTNGTAVDGRALAGAAAAALRAGARVQLGEVEAIFTPAPVCAAPRRRRRTTWAGGEALSSGGIVRLAGHTIALTARELRLVAILAERRRAVADPELAYVPSTEIIAALGFRSIDADGDNVRELVLRVRRKLRAAGAGDLIQTRRGAGYRLGGEMEPLRAAA